MKWAVINANSNIVENIIVWDGKSPWAPPQGYLCVECGNEAEIGDIYQNGTFIHPTLPPVDGPNGPTQVV